MDKPGFFPSYYSGLNSYSFANLSPIANPPRGGGLRKLQQISSTIETPFRYLLNMKISDVLPEDIVVVVNDHSLVIEVEKEFLHNRVNRSSWENSYGIFTRVFQLPDDADPNKIFYRVFENQLVIDIFKTGLAKAADQNPVREQTQVQSAQI